MTTRPPADRVPDDLPYLDLAAPGFSTRSAEVRAARDRHWCARTPYGLAVLRHREAGVLLRDRRLRQGSYAWPDKIGMRGSFAAFWMRSIISQEGEPHRQLRALAMSALSPLTIEATAPRFRNIAQALCQDLRGRSQCEFVGEFCSPFAGRVVCALLGLDEAGWRPVATDATLLGRAMGIDGQQHEAEINAACDRLSHLAETLIAKARMGDADGAFIPDLVARFDASGQMSDRVLVDLIVMSIFGGVDTTRAQLGIALSLFAAHPAEWQALRRDPGLVTNAVEEVIRAQPTTTWSTREALEDIPFGAITIRAGETLHIFVHATARDPAICETDAFDITRRRKAHFGFGGGAHACLGQSVARCDIAIALQELAKTLASVQCDGAAEWEPDSGNTGPVRLPMRYTLNPT